MATKTLITPFLLSSGLPALGLISSSINIRDADSGELLISGALLDEVGDGFYRYNFTEYTSSINYAIRFDGTSVLEAGRYTFTANDHGSFDVFEEPLASHTSSVFLSGSITPLSSSGQTLNFLKDIEGGRWKIDTSLNEMVFFKEDNITEIARFSLFDSTGSAGSIDVFERVRKS